MSWKKHFTRYDGNGSASPSSKTSRWSSWLPEVYSGLPNRVERYSQYDLMDQDSEINAALDTIAEFSTQFDSTTRLPFKIHYKDDATEAEINALETSLRQWCNINDFERRIHGVFRSTIKYGDHFFIRDPETYKLFWVNPADVVKAIINDSTGKEVEQYIIKNISLNLKDLVVTDTKKIGNPSSGATTGYTVGTGVTSNTAGIYQGKTGASGNTEYAVDANNVVHIALNDGMNTGWPFGISILDSVFKVYKQKELLEDSIIIYRVQRAPERRVFYIDVGNMPAHKAMAFVERTKNEVHQTRIPNMTGGGTKVMDAAYNPLSIMEDYFFAQTAEGRGSKVEVLPGGDNLGEIDDLKYFNNKLMRGLRIPSSYLPTGAEDGTAVYNDGRVGTAMIQEFRFSKYCGRLQMILQPGLDKEFKMFLKYRGVEVPSNLFDLQFTEPQSFSQYRDLELDSAKTALFSNIEGVPYLSRRFILGKYLGLTEEEIVENERMWKEENTTKPDFKSDSSSDLSALGVRTADINNFEPTAVDDDIEADDTDVEVDIGAAGESPISGAGGETDEI
jgi:hypothetical protein